MIGLVGFVCFFVILFWVGSLFGLGSGGRERFLKKNVDSLPEKELRAAANANEDDLAKELCKTGKVPDYSEALFLASLAKTRAQARQSSTSAQKFDWRKRGGNIICPHCRVVNVCKDLRPGSKWWRCFSCRELFRRVKPSPGDAGRGA